MVNSTDDPQRQAYYPNAVLKAFRDSGRQLPYESTPTVASLRDGLVALGLMAEDDD